jgi:hypothetical protein
LQTRPSHSRARPAPRRAVVMRGLLLCAIHLLLTRVVAIDAASSSPAPPSEREPADDDDDAFAARDAFSPAPAPAPAPAPDLPPLVTSYEDEIALSIDSPEYVKGAWLLGRATYFDAPTRWKETFDHEFGDLHGGALVRSRPVFIRSRPASSLSAALSARFEPAPASSPAPRP